MPLNPETEEDTPLREQEDNFASDVASQQTEPDSADVADEAQISSDQPDSLYNPSKTVQTGGAKGKLLQMGSNKVLVGGMGAGLVGIIVVIGSMLGFLNTFKLEHIMKNIEARGFVRYQVAMSGRSSKYINTYIMLRMGEVSDPDAKPADRDNMWFRSNKVKSGPVFDWYRTMRTSSFEDDLWKNHGIRFTSKIEKVGGAYKIKWAKIRTKDNIYNLELPTGNIDVSDPSQLNGTAKKFFEEAETFDSDKAARKAIKEAVEAETKSWQVIKRRHIRKNIQNMIGVRKWRFFETTRDKFDQKKISVRNKIIKTALPDSTVTGKFIQCIFGIAICDSTSDPGDPKNQASGDATSGRNKDGGHEAETDANGDPVPNENANDEVADAITQVVGEAAEEGAEEATEEALQVGVKTMLMKKIMTQIASSAGGPLKIFDIASTIDALTRISTGIKNHSLSKMVSLARAAQAMGLFSMYMTANDQLKTGEVTGPEVNEFMQTVGSVSNSEGWTNVISNSKESVKAESFAAAKDEKEYCSAEHQEAILKPENRKVAEQEFAYLCGNAQIGGKTNAKIIEDWWNNTVGPVVDPLIGFYNKTPLGTIIGGVNNIIGGVIGAITTPVMNRVVSVLGLEDNIDSMLGWVINFAVTTLGAGPMMDGNEPSGLFVNQIIQGSSATAEASARAQGAAKTNKQTAELARKNTVAYQKEQQDGQSLFTKYASLENPNSALSSGLFASIEGSTVNNVTSIIGTTLKRIAKAPLSLFSFGKAKAGTDDPYSASKFAGIDTYDFPQECYDLNPLTMEPDQVTNVDENGIIPKSELTWELVNDNTAFYAKMYENLRNSYGSDANKVEEAALKIYNCGALDTTVRGGLGAMYGYTDDNGLETSSSTDSGTSSAGGIGSDLSWLKKNADEIPCFGTSGETKDLGIVQSKYTGYLSNGKAPKIRLCQISSIGGVGNNTQGSLVSGGAVVASGVSENWYKLGKAAKDEKNINLSASSSFRLADSCGGNGDGVMCASPGQSPHQAGIAIDFNNMNSGNSGVGSCSNRSSYSSEDWKWMKDNAEKFGLYQYMREAWHWDPIKNSTRCDSKGPTG